MVANKMISRAAVLLATAAPMVSALGNAIVHNQCNFPVSLSVVSNVAGATQELPANGGEYTESYQNNPDGGGISMKIWASDISNITQFEYTLEGSSLWYDLSNINGYPFMPWGVNIIPSDSSCNQVICPAGVELCADAYNTPTEDWATAECSSDADMVVLLCSGAEDTTPISGSSVSSVVASATSKASSVASSTPVSVASSTPVSVATSTPVASSTASSTAVITPTTLATSTTKNNGVVVETTFVTQVFTVVAEPTATPWWEHRPAAKKERRHIGRHQHRHGAQI